MKFFYILPGFNDSVHRLPYRNLRKEAEKIGYNVMNVQIDWDNPLSKQLFVIPENSVVMGFSMGAIFARLLAQKNSIKLLICASMTPLKYFTENELEKDITEAIGKPLVKDIKKSILDKNFAKKEILMYGEKEQNNGADIIIKNTGHTLSKNYIDEIIKLLKIK